MLSSVVILIAHDEQLLLQELRFLHPIAITSSNRDLRWTSHDIGSALSRRDTLHFEMLFLPFEISFTEVIPDESIAEAIALCAARVVQGMQTVAATKASNPEFSSVAASSHIQWRLVDHCFEKRSPRILTVEQLEAQAPCGLSVYDIDSHGRAETRRQAIV